MAKFTVDTHLFRELGDLLVGRDSTALVELIKNSYDADATSVSVYGEALDDLERAFVRVTDDGVGMTASEFEEGFLRVASRTKELGDRISKRYQRRYTGSKGIGRLAAHKLARFIEVYSVPWEELRSLDRKAVVASIDWDEVESKQTLDDLEGTNAIRLDPEQVSIDVGSGTIIMLRRLRRRWTPTELGRFLLEIQTFYPPSVLEELPRGVVGQTLLFDKPTVRDTGRLDPGIKILLEGEFTPGDDYWQNLAQAANWVIEIDARSVDGKVLYAVAPTPKALQEYSEAERRDFLIDHPAPQVGPSEDVEDHSLRDADLVLVDYRLDDWPERENVRSISLKPLNGLALAAVLREQAYRGGGRQSPKAFALRSAHLRELSSPLPSDSREHVLARAHNLEWVFPKTKTSWGVPVFEQIRLLSNAVRQLPVDWPQDSAEQTWDTVRALLALPEELWMQRALEDVEDCYPPLHKMSDASHGLAFLRWLLHSILPYPCFLWNTHYLAARLRITYESFHQAIEEDLDLVKLFEPSKYEGILAGFLGPRWWRSSIEAFIWDSTNGSPFDIALLHSILASKTRSELQPIEFLQPVVCVDNRHRPLSTLFSIEDAVRIQPDDWPPYADQAWTLLELAKQDPTLGALVVSQDRDRLD